jgi:methionine-gamma-lyase
MGADIVVHSATKYLGGHGDLIAGAVVGRAEVIQQIRLFGLKDMTGAVISPINAFLILRGIKTLQLRMERHCQNAHVIAQLLDQHPAVGKVFYPGLKTDVGHDLATRQMDGFGGMVAFELKEGFEGATKMLNRLKLIKRAVSLGDTETLIQHPASMTHSTYTPEQQAEHGISRSLVRISAGLESVADIVADLEQALLEG